MDIAKRKVYIDRHFDLGDDSSIRDELIEGFLASSPHWEETDAGDERLSIHFSDNVTSAAGLAPNASCQFRLTVKVRRPNGSTDVGRTALRADFFTTKNFCCILEVDESAQYSKYLELWDPGYVETKSFFKSIQSNQPIGNMTMYDFGKAIGIALADIINAEPEREVSE